MAVCVHCARVFLFMKVKFTHTDIQWCAGIVGVIYPNRNGRNISVRGLNSENEVSDAKYVLEARQEGLK